MPWVLFVPTTVAIPQLMLDAISIQRLKYSRLVAATGIVVGVWLLGQAGLLEPIDGRIYDGFSRWSSWLRPPPVQVLLVEADSTEGEFTAERALELIRLLKDELSARHVAFLSIPRNTDEAFWRHVEGYSGIVFGRRWDVDGRGRREPRIEVIPENARARFVEFGVAHVDEGARGVHRRQKAWFDIDGERLYSLEAKLIPSAEQRQELLRDSEYRVHFAGPPGSLPVVRARRIFERRLVPELVSGRTVIVGHSDPVYAYLDTPTTRSDQKMSALEFHGHAANTLVTGEVRGSMGALSTLLIVLFVALVTTILLQWCGAAEAAWVTGLALIGAMVVGYILFVYRGIWFPGTEMILTQLSVFVMAMRQRAASTESRMRGLLTASDSKIRKKHAPTPLDVRTEAWPLVVNMINQTLDVQRSVFLEAEAGSSILREVRALGCSFDDVIERRRDYGRAPYDTALENGGPIRVEGYLRQGFENEDQFMIPLSYAGEVVGFWACAIDSAKTSGENIEGILGDYAILVSELLYQKRQATRTYSWWDKVDAYFTHDAGEQVYRDLKMTLEITEGRLRQVETLLSNIHTATIVYDLFGRVLHVNDRLLTLFENQKLNPYKMTALDFVAAVSDYDVAWARKILRHVVIEQQPISMPAKLGRDSETRYLLHLHPLHFGSVDARSDALKELGGKSVLFELVDTTAFTGVYAMKDRLTSRLGVQIRGDLASIDVSSSLLGSDGISPDQRRHISRVIHDKVSRTMDVLVECQQYLALDGSAASVERFPVDAQDALRSALGETEGELSGRGITVTVDEPRLMSLVLASTGNLVVVLRSILRLLGADAIDGSEIQIEVEEREDLVSIRFRNTGFGVPNERFQEYLHGDTTLASEELKTLREGILWVQSWGGDLEAYSEVGAGTEATVRLVRFI